MVFAVETKIKTSTAGFRSLLKKLNEACNTVVVSGVIHGDAETTGTAIQNEFGELGVYTKGPYAGQTVMSPKRPFVESAIRYHRDEIISTAQANLDLENDPTLVKVLNAVGKKTKELQEKTLETNGEGVAGWQKHNSKRTIETKGFDKPLYNQEGSTFPIDYELKRRSA